MSTERALPGFRSQYMKTERKMYAKMFIMFIVLLVTIIMGILSIYWGADHSLQFNMPVATVAIIDLDGGEVGPAMSSYATQFRQQHGTMSLGYVNTPAGQYPSNEAARAALKNEDFWIGIIVQSNATTLMNYAYQNGNTTYDPTGAIQVIYAEGRNSLVIAEFLLPQLNTFMSGFVAQFSKQKQASLLTTNTGNAAALMLQAQLPIPVNYATFNTAPAVPSTAEAATEIGTIYLIIVSFVSVLMFDKLNEAMLGKFRPRTYMVWRIALLPTVYFFLSLFYMALSCAWMIRLDKFFGGAGYFIFWMLSWCSMMAFGLVVENVNNALGPPFTPVFFVFWVISNVSTGFYPVEFLSNFYLWGLAWPLRHNLIGAKAIIYGTKNVLGLNFGVTLAWVFLSLTLLPLTVKLQMHKKKAVYEKQRTELMERKYGSEESKSSSSEE
ncbi:Putative uncharacterized protein [Taphrina deformans PYCC 5710]|uniref:DUF3533 domain-containing protein n=1 Tax=Taphrina deformans (strain PYCC 5710 / ATCC 11124 / CBS 356.35 / IMI 108563 / JCM 9778 / NBRC 8474) TaxID=1097556 RepID=R4XGP0_TAPDE|nr:Putative uncharacterized protein [Taphrina deformans PYCC 5710]|eukprot:CCG82556.1 Putative uncharacterized protein [Taphrina deformans PYCC 5710]